MAQLKPKLCPFCGTHVKCSNEKCEAELGWWSNESSLMQLPERETTKKTAIDFYNHLRTKYVRTMNGNFLNGVSNFPIPIELVYDDWIASRQPEQPEAKPTCDNCGRTSPMDCKNCEDLDYWVAKSKPQQPDGDQVEPDRDRIFREELERRWPSIATQERLFNNTGTPFQFIE
jgi:hypothetical protein